MFVTSHWLTATTLSLSRARQSLSAKEHTEILEPLLPGHASGQRIAALRDAMFASQKVNTSESRAAGHWALRVAALDAPPAPLPTRFAPDGVDLLPRMRETHAQTRILARAIHSGTWRTSSGNTCAHVVHLGIGGSDTGPKLLIDALQDCGKPVSTHSISVHFLSNLDYHATVHTLASLNPQATLVVLVSKSMSTQETMNNAQHVLRWMSEAGVVNPKANLIAVTSQTNRADAMGVPPAQTLWFDDSIGGRFSLWGPVSLTARIALGNDSVDALIAGGAEMDAHFVSQPLVQNMPAVLAATDLYNLRTRQLPTLMVSAYDSRLSQLVPYLKQLWMESLGKHVDSGGRPIDGPACPILWGDVGTNAQHAFFQLLHQGMQGVSIDLIGVITPEHQEIENHQALLANLIAQAQALSIGRANDDANKSCWGGHPVNLMLMKKCDARGLGALLALWEHRVLCLAALTGVNPFDQWGVELGKSIATSALQALSLANASNTTDSTSELDAISLEVVKWLQDASREEI